MGLSRAGAVGATPVLTIAFAAALAPLFGGFFPEGRGVQVPLHSATEAVGVLAAFLLAYLILQIPSSGDHGAARRLWTACGLVAIGVLDTFHAAVPPGDLFVWLHSMSLLVGGLLFSLVWLPRHAPPALSRALPFGIAAATTVLSVLSIAYSGALPPMVIAGEFTVTAVAINLLGGMLFLLAAARFAKSYREKAQNEDLMAATLALLFGLSGLLFGYSEVWNADWWLWHLLRLTAYVVAAVYVLTVFRNVRLSRLRSEEALRKSEADLKRAQSVGRIGSWRLDVETGELHWSDETYRLFGMAKDTPVTLDVFLAGVHPEDRDHVSREWRKALHGAPYDIEHRIVVNGKVRWVRERAETDHTDGTVPSVLGTVQDITDRKRADEALRRKSDELEHMNSELEEFVYIASHDLKAPLRAVANLSLMLAEDLEGTLDEENLRRMKLLRERVKNMDALIEALLGYARLGRTEPKRVPVDLGVLLTELVRDLGIPSGFRIEMEEPLPMLAGDPLQLRQIFQNLITNARDHHDKACGVVSIRARERANSWLLETADDGPGIPEKERTRIFRMFSTGSDAGHTGIGLAVVRKLVLANGGRIDVADQKPRGTVFRIEWPKHSLTEHTSS